MVLPTFVNYQKESENEQLLVAEHENPTENVQTGVFDVKVGVAVLVVGSLILAVFAVVNKMNFPSDIMQSSSVQLDTLYKSDSRFAPLFMSSYVEKEGIVKGFMEKYGFQINTELPTSTEVIKGDPAYWILSTITTGTSCSGNVVSVGGMAGATCVAAAVTSSTNSFMLTCTSGLSGAVYVTAYANDDCTGSTYGYQNQHSTLHS